MHKYKVYVKGFEYAGNFLIKVSVSFDDLLRGSFNGNGYIKVGKNIRCDIFSLNVSFPFICL